MYVQATADRVEARRERHEEPSLEDETHREGLGRGWARRRYRSLCVDATLGRRCNLALRVAFVVLISRDPGFA